jgi:uncharacterized protein GlcG (DUF336 family)
MQGTSIVIEGTVMDISAGSKQEGVIQNFPQGLPAVSDTSQSQWMEYVYKQQTKPTNATGVPVTINVVDANGNYRTIGTTTSDATGFFSYQWTPDITGKYTVYASFGGSESYWPSQATSVFAVDEPAATPAPTQALTASAADAYLLPGIIAIIIAIAIVGAVLLLAIRRRP